MDDINKELINEVCERVWTVNGSLRGVGGLLVRPSKESEITSEELYGLGQLLQKLAEELGILEDILRCGYSTIGNEGKPQFEVQFKGSKE